MKKLFAGVTFFTLLLTSIGVTKVLAEDPTPDAVSQEAERSRELLEIWKDHVKTLTKERDTAYKEIERLKTSAPAPAQTAAPMARFGAVETMPLGAPDPGRMQAMQSEIEALRGQLKQHQQPKIIASDRESQMQLSSMQNQLQQVKKELSETQSEKDRLIQEKERALSQVERLKAEKENAPTVIPAGEPDAIAASLQKALDIQKKRNADLQSRHAELEAQMQSLSTQRASESSSEDQRTQIQIRQMESQLQELKAENERLQSQSGSGQSLSSSDEEAVRAAKQLRYENNTLLAKTERLQAVEKELQSTRSYFMPMVEELQGKNRTLSGDNQQMKSQIAQWQGEMDEISQRAQQSATENQSLKQELATLHAETDSAAEQIASLKSQLQISEADKDKYQSIEEESQKLKAEVRELVQAKNDAVADSRAFEEQVRSSTGELDALRKDNDSLRNREQKATKQIEALRTRLRANLTDMKNLKSNFESYLDSLVTSFDDRQKQTS